ncbi:MAG: glycosyltransferase family 4 protein [Rhizobiaceae bacterium]
MNTIAVVLKGYPRLSETFIAQELLELERAGFRLRLFSMRHPTDRKTHPINDEIKAPVIYLPEYLYQEPLRVFRSWLRARKLPGYRKALKVWIADLRRDLTPNRIRRFGQALVLACELPNDVARLYGHFIHTPGSVTRYTHLMTGLPWSCSAHAKDIWTSPDWELSEKLDSASWTATCTAAGHRQLQSLAQVPQNVHLIYHGLDLQRFPEPAEYGSQRDGSDPSNPVKIVTVGRAVEKKGLDTLVDALSTLPGDLNWSWTHIGGGTLSDALKSQVERLELSDRVKFLGSQPQTKVIEQYRSSDLFVLPCRIAADGDRDGLPNVLVEAASQKLACVSTPISGIVELFTDESDGLLVEPDNIAALSAAIERLARDPALRHELGKAAADRVRAEFDARQTIHKLTGLFLASGVKPELIEA